ncbi:hypothetical protein AOLI_G00185320 [Acnodon oligacanthus]
MNVLSVPESTKASFSCGERLASSAQRLPPAPSESPLERQGARRPLNDAAVTDMINSSARESQQLALGSTSLHTAVQHDELQEALKGMGWSDEERTLLGTFLCDYNGEPVQTSKDFTDQGLKEWLQTPNHHQVCLHTASIPIPLLQGARAVEGVHEGGYTRLVHTRLLFQSSMLLQFLFFKQLQCQLPPVLLILIQCQFPKLLLIQ